MAATERYVRVGFLGDAEKHQLALNVGRLQKQQDLINAFLDRRRLEPERHAINIVTGEIFKVQ